MGQCVSHAAGENAQDKKPTIAQRISKWPDVPGPLPNPDPNSPISATLTGGGGLALNVRPLRKQATLEDSSGKKEPLAIIYAHHDGKPTAWPAKVKALGAALALRQSHMDAGARATALGAAAARAAAATTTVSGLDARLSSDGTENVGRGCRQGGGSSEGKMKADTTNSEIFFNHQMPVTETELRAISCFGRSSRGSNLGPDEEGADGSEVRNEPWSAHLGPPGRGPEKAWMEELLPQLQQQVQPKPEVPGTSGSAAVQQEASPDTAGTVLSQAQPEESSVLGRKSSRFSTPCQDLDAGPEQWPDEAHELMKSGAAVVAALAAAAVAAAATAHYAKATMLKASVPQPGGQSQPAMILASREGPQGKPKVATTPAIAAEINENGTPLQRPAYHMAAANMPEGNDNEGGGVDVGTTGEGGGGRWASRLAPNIPSSTLKGQQQEQQEQQQQQQRLLAPSASKAEEWSPATQPWRHSCNDDHSSSQKRQGSLSSDTGDCSRPYRASTPGSSSRLLRRTMANRVRVAVAGTWPSTVNGCTDQPHLGESSASGACIASSGNTATVGIRSDSGMYDPAAGLQGARTPGQEQGVLTVMAISSGVGGFGATSPTYKHPEVAHAEVEAEADPRDGLKVEQLNVAAGNGGAARGHAGNGGGGVCGGKGEGGNGGDKSGGTKWTRSRAGRTLDLLRMQAAARRVVEDLTRQKQSRVRLEYAAQTSMQRRPCAPPSTPPSYPSDDKCLLTAAEHATCDAECLPYKDDSGEGAADMHSSLQMPSQPPQSPLQPPPLPGLSGSPSVLPDARMSGILHRKVVSERVLWPHGHTDSDGGGGCGASAHVNELVLYSVPGSTEPVPVRDLEPQLQNGPPPPPLPPGQLPSQYHDHHGTSSQNNLWLHHQAPHQKPPPPSPLTLPPPLEQQQQQQQQRQQPHSGPLLKTSSSLQLQPPSADRTLNHQPSLGRQARLYFHQVSQMQAKREELVPAITSGIVRRSTYSGQAPRDDITSDRTMRLYPPPSTTTKSAALMAGQQSGKLLFTGVMAKRDLITPSPRPQRSPPLSPLPSLPPPQLHLQRKESRLGAVGVGPRSPISSNTPVDPQQQQQQQHFAVVEADQRQLDPTPPKLVTKRSWPARNEPLREVDSGLVNTSNAAAPSPELTTMPPVVAKSLAHRHSEPYWPTSDSSQVVPLPESPPPQATAAPHPMLVPPLPGLL